MNTRNKSQASDTVEKVKTQTDGASELMTDVTRLQPTKGKHCDTHTDAVKRVSECWRFYAMSTARVIFTAKTSLDVFSLSREQVWTFSSLG